jgi:hypothetical protein
MAVAKLYVGPKLREPRKRFGLTQRAFCRKAAYRVALSQPDGEQQRPGPSEKKLA